MKLQEYHSKEIFARYGVPIPRGRLAHTPAEARLHAEWLDGSVVVKAQVLAGGRGKAGGVRRADTPEEAERVAARILGMQIKGMPVGKVLVDEAISTRSEIYLGITIDRAARRVVVMASAEGGVEIEEIASASPEKIIMMPVEPPWSLRDHQIRSLAAGLGLSRDLWRSFTQVARGLYETFMACDASLAEINPLVVTEEGLLLGVDGKLVLDDNALGRHPDLAEMRDLEEEHRLERKAREEGLSYIRLDGDIGCMVNGAGLAMATMDVIKLLGAAPANFLDIGGGARADKVSAALNIILADGGVKAVLLNVFGGITRCDEVAKGILAAISEVKPVIPMVARLVGTNEEEGRRILAEAGMMTATSLSEAARKAVDLAKGVD
ncbi:MAG: ADP-forming succinate--CoA ligase subunit beta [Anaerolineae bacterium]|nr:ADP-forming succinate--CoA ligase subunit beta [Anaerolineae bacterium]